MLQLRDFASHLLFAASRGQPMKLRSLQVALTLTIAMAADIQTLIDELATLQAAGALPRQFRVADVLKHLRHQYTRAYLNGVLSTYTADTGAAPKRGFRPRFRRVGRGLYELYEKAGVSGPAQCERSGQ